MSQENFNLYMERLASETVTSNSVLYTATKNRGDLFNYRFIQVDSKYIDHVIKPFRNSLSTKNPHVLEIGSGRGEEANEFDKIGCKTTRIDLSMIGLKLQEGKDLVCATSWSLPFKNMVFDGIHCKDVYTHIPPDLRLWFFKEMKRVLSANGKILMATINTETFARLQYPVRVVEIENLTELAGLQIKTKTEWTHDIHESDWYRLCIENKYRQIFTIEPNINS